MDAMCFALRRLVEARRRRNVGRAIAEGYTRVPLTAEELECSVDLTRQMIDEEPW